MGGEFDARLKRNTVTTRTSKSDGRELTVSNPLAIVEARFSYRVLDRLYFPNFVAIERSVDGETRYVVYEVVGVSPTHYQLAGIDSSMPTLLRKEFLDTIKESWGKSQETWIDLMAIPTSYVATIDGTSLEFSRAPHAPLPGAQAFLLSRDAVHRFLCEAEGEQIGTMAGFDLPFTVNMDNLIRYHCGFFAFTGSGKSNLTSALVRRALRRDPALTLVVFDIAGEYVVNLLDLLDRDAKVLSTEGFDSEDEFVNSQAIPESLEDSAGRGAIEAGLRRVYAHGVEKVSLQEAGGLDLAWIQSLLQGTVDNARAGATPAKLGLTRLSLAFYEKRGLRPSTRLTELDDEARRELALLLREINEKVNERSGLRSDLDLIIGMLESGDFGSSSSTGLTPERLAENLARGTAAKLNVLYMPDPYQARMTAERLLRRLLFLKKKVGNRQRILVVLDEAQEYIPDEHTDKEYTTQSNRAVEQLLRQGRKYRLHCWMATQRVARLNVNALQQLHSYFVSTLPRMYDRMVIADAFALPYEVLERSADLGTGEWLFVSFKAAKQRNVPVFLKTENNENFIAAHLKSGK
jgi:DNA helicase HerA-like ATPase